MCKTAVPTGGNEAMTPAIAVKIVFTCIAAYVAIGGICLGAWKSSPNFGLDSLEFQTTGDVSCFAQPLPPLEADFLCNDIVVSLKMHQGEKMSPPNGFKAASHALLCQCWQAPDFQVAAPALNIAWQANRSIPNAFSGGATALMTKVPCRKGAMHRNHEVREYIYGAVMNDIITDIRVYRTLNDQLQQMSIIWSEKASLALTHTGETTYLDPDMEPPAELQSLLAAGFMFCDEACVDGDHFTVLSALKHAHYVVLVFLIAFGYKAFVRSRA